MSYLETNPVEQGPGVSRRSVIRLAGGVAAGAAAGSGIAVLGAGPAAAADGAAPGIIPQAGPVPLVIDQRAATDNVTVLLGAGAARTEGTSVYASDEGRKNFFVQGFDSTAASLSWQVSVQAGDRYHVFALVDAQPGQQLAVAVNGRPAAAFTTEPATVWQKADAGTVLLPAGTSTITLTRTGTLVGDLYVKSLELIRQCDLPGYRRRVAARRADTRWFSKTGYGLMFQYGSWGFPNNAGGAKPLQQQAADFDVARFVKMVKDTGAGYVIWSFSWWGYHADAPIRSIDAIVTAAGGPAAPGLTADRDLIGEVARACQAAGIRFLMYYHTGDEDSGWWPYQDYPRSFSADGSGDRSVFFANWQRVVTEIGTRYGRDLDGFFLDDGIIYYPAPFEALQKAARAGNPDRLVSWNNWIMPRLTEFQDVAFGEGSHGEAADGSARPGGDGVFTSGPYQGLLQHGMFTMGNDWGIHFQGQGSYSDPSVTSAAAIGWARAAAARHVPISFDLMMFEDGTVNERDLMILNDVRQAVRGTVPPAGPAAVVADDTVRTITADGDSYTYTFSGTGADLLGETGPGRGLIDVYVDDTLITTVDADGRTHKSRQVLYGARHLMPGDHTLKAVKKSGSVLTLDALRVIPNPSMVNDDDAAVAYTGGWTHSGNRGAGDYNDDVHWTATDGDSLTVTFAGTGVDVLGPMEPVDGKAAVVLDGKGVGGFDAAYAGPYAAQQSLYSARYLKPGKHTLTLTKTGGNYLQIDAFRIWP